MCIFLCAVKCCADVIAMLKLWTLLLPLTSASRAMPKNKRKDEVKPQAAQPDVWVSHAVERLDELRAEAPPDYTAGAAAWERAARLSVGASSSSACAEESLSPPQQQEPTYNDVHRSAALRVHRASGLLATGFEPQRHTTFVKGRPLQVSRDNNLLWIF